MSWHFVERWLQKVNQHSTLIGKFWITFLIVFRIVVVSSVSDRVYSDEQSEFKCNTNQPGCPNVCFNQFSPLSHIRFWSFQIIMVATPSIMFMVYSAHQVKKSPDDDKDERGKRKKSRHLKEMRSAVSDDPEAEKKRLKTLVLQEMFGDDKLAFSQNYVLYAFSVVARTVIEAFFIYLQYTMFGFKIAEIYKCKGAPCPNTIDCFISRPMEKTIFLWFMFVIAIISATLNVLELYYIIYQFGVRKKRVKKKKLAMMRRPSSKARFDEISDAEILDGGIPPAPGTQPSPPPPPDYKGVTAPTCMKGLATSISLDEAILAEQQRKGNYPCTPKETRLSNAGSNAGYHGNAFLPPIHVVLRNNSKDGGKPIVGTPPIMGQNVDINAKEYFNYI